MTKDEALKLVLADIETNIAAVRTSTITAIKEALAQPQQEPVGVVNVEHFRGQKSMENVDFQLMADLPPGQHLVYTFPPQTQQEPVACEPNDAELFKAFTRSNNGPNPFYRCNTCGDTEPGVREYLSAHWLKHNTSPPPVATQHERTWVNATTWRGLTDLEISQLWIGTSPYFNEDDFARAIEAKLKAKNETAQD